MIKVNLLVVAAVAFWLPSAQAGVITSAGSTTVQPAMKACGTAYKKTHSGMQIIIAGGGSSKGAKSIGHGNVDIGRASRAIKDKEKAAYPDMQTFKVGTDGVVIVVHASNSLSAITSEQVEKLFKGSTNNWQSLGGDSGPVSLISLGLEHGTYELFAEKFHLNGKEEDGDIVFDNGHAWLAFSQDVLLDKVAHDTHAISFASVGIAEEYAKNHDVKLLSLDGVAPTAANVVNGTYKLSRPLLIMTKGQPTGEVKEFVDYMQASECQGIVKKLGYIPVI